MEHNVNLIVVELIDYGHLKLRARFTVDGLRRVAHHADDFVNKETFDLLVIPGANRGNGGPYGDHKRYDFFVHHLLGVEPPDWNRNPGIKELFAALAPAEAADIDEAASFFADQSYGEANADGRVEVPMGSGSD